MASVSIIIPDALIPRLRDAMHWRFPGTVGMNDAAAFKAQTAEYWLGILVDYEGQQAEIAYAQGQVNAGAAARLQAQTDGAGIG